MNDVDVNQWYFGTANFTEISVVRPRLKIGSWKLSAKTVDRQKLEDKKISLVRPGPYSLSSLFQIFCLFSVKWMNIKIRKLREKNLSYGRISTFVFSEVYPVITVLKENETRSETKLQRKYRLLAENGTQTIALKPLDVFSPRCCPLKIKEIYK